MRRVTVSRFAVAAVVSGMAITASAADGGWYGGLSLGRSVNRFDTASFASGLAGVSESQNRNDQAFKFFGGYQFDRNFGVEAGYTDLGKFSYNYSGAAAANDSYKVHAWTLAGTATAPLGQGFSLFGKLGLAATRATSSINDPTGVLTGTTSPALLGNGSHSRTSLLWGAGLEYDLTKALVLRAEYEDYGRVGDTGSTGQANDSMWSVGLKLRF